MTDQTRAVLDAATPRPWEEGDYSDEICGPDGPEMMPVLSLESVASEWQANSKLVRLAVNSYEAREQLIDSLTEALEECTRLALSLHLDRGAASRRIEDISHAALRLARERKP